MKVNPNPESGKSESAASVESRLIFFRNMVRCCFPVEFWEYDKNLSLVYGLTAENELMSYFFKYSSAYTSLMDYLQKGHTSPALVHARQGLYWMADFVLKDGEADRIFLMGPFAMNQSVRQQIQQMFHSAEHPLDVHKKLTETLYHIPMIPSAYLFQYAIMFHYCISGEKISVSDIQHPYPSREHDKDDIFSSEERNETPPSERHSGAWEAQSQLMKAVETGNLNYRAAMEQAALASSGVRMKDAGTVRNGKDSIILFTGLCTYAAISGGLPPEIAYDMCDQYVDMAESADSVSELIHVSDIMLDDYVRKVHRYQTDSPLSRPVRICCDYIHMNVTQDLSIEKLARLCGYTDYYLSRKFKKETGVPLGEYILHTKLDQACLLLRTTSHSIQDISDSLAFSSRSYFSTAFQKYMGISPKEYRESTHRNEIKA